MAGKQHAGVIDVTLGAAGIRDARAFADGVEQAFTVGVSAAGSSGLRPSGTSDPVGAASYDLGVAAAASGGNKALLAETAYSGDAPG